MTRWTIAAFLIAAAATALRAPFVDFYIDAHPDEPIVGTLGFLSVKLGRVTANWNGIPGEEWSRSTYQFSPYTLVENGLALAANRMVGRPTSVDEQIVFGRWFSVAAGGLAILVCFFAARAWFGDPPTALLAELFLGISFLHVQDCCYARVEAFLSLVVLLAVWAAGAALHASTMGRCMVLGLLIGVVIATKYNAAPIVVLVLAPLFSNPAGIKFGSLIARTAGAAVAVPVGFFLAMPETAIDLQPLIKGIQWEAAHYSMGDVPHQAIDETDGNLKFWFDYLARLGLGWVPTLAAVGFVLTCFRRRRGLLFSLFLIAAASLLIVVKVRYERNAEILLGPACMAAAAFLVWFATAFNGRAMRTVLCTVVSVAVGATVVQNAVALRRFRVQQQPASSPFRQLPESIPPVVKHATLSGYLHDPIKDDWRHRPALLLAGHSDPFSQTALKVWRERLKDDWNVEILESPWFKYGYPFSTVESYHGPGFLMWATRKANAAYHHGAQPGRSGRLNSNPEITAEELHRRRTAGDMPRIIDVRNPDEAAICKITGSELIPLADLPKRIAELDSDEEIVVHCKMGGRSAQAAAFLRAQGFRNVRNLTGGILAWIDKVEPTLTRY